MGPVLGPSTWLPPGPAAALWAIWGVTQKMRDLYLLSLIRKYTDLCRLP